MKKVRFLFLILALILVVGMTTGLIVRKQSGGQSVMQHSSGSASASEGGQSTVDEVYGIDPEGVYLFLTKDPVSGFTLQIDGDTVIQDSDVSGISPLAGDYLSTSSICVEGAVYFLPTDGVTLTIGGVFSHLEQSKLAEENEPEETRAGYRALKCYVFYYDGTFDSYSARQNDDPVSIILPANVQFVCVMNEISN